MELGRIIIALVYVSTIYLAVATRKYWMFVIKFLLTGEE